MSKFILIIALVTTLVNCGTEPLDCETEGMIVPEYCIDDELGTCFEMLKICWTIKCEFPDEMEAFGIAQYCDNNREVTNEKE